MAESSSPFRKAVVIDVINDRASIQDPLVASGTFNIPLPHVYNAPRGSIIANVISDGNSFSSSLEKILW